MAAEINTEAELRIKRVPAATIPPRSATHDPFGICFTLLNQIEQLLGSVT